jgi:hypothetical protein
MENLIKLHKAQLASDRMSCHSATANQVRLVLHTAAFWLMHGVGAAIPRNNPLASAEFATIRERLIKIGARVNRAHRAHPHPAADQLPGRRVVPNCCAQPTSIRPLNGGVLCPDEPPPRQFNPNALAITCAFWCHTHIHGDAAKFPWFPERTYTLEMAVPEEMTVLHKPLKIQRVVIVTPSVYGPENSATIYGIAARGKDARGVAVIDQNTTDAELDRLASLGFKAYASICRPSASAIPKLRRNASSLPLPVCRDATGMFSSIRHCR